MSITFRKTPAGTVVGPTAAGVSGPAAGSVGGPATGVQQQQVPPPVGRRCRPTGGAWPLTVDPAEKNALTRPAVLALVGPARKGDWHGN